MGVVKVIFFVSSIIIFYSYIGYGLLLLVLNKINRRFTNFSSAQPTGIQEFPTVALLVPAYNEAAFIKAKISNTLLLDYPPEKLSVIFVTDGSTDQTPDILRSQTAFTVYHKSEREGKGMAINRVVKQLSQDIVIFNDANTMLNRRSIRELVKHFADPRVGGVSGEKRIVPSIQTDVEAPLAGEGLYWRYESFLKRQDAAFYSIVGAAGELFAIRRELFEPIRPGTIIEDFVLSLQICLKGYIISYEPKAYASETASETIREEQKRKIRISAGAFQAMVQLRSLLDIFRHPRLSFQYISHRVLRWTLAPLCLVTVLLSNCWLAVHDTAVLYKITLAAQALFYAMAFAGWLLARFNSKSKMLIIPYYLLFMNTSVFIGFYRFITRKQSAIWQKSRRSAQ